MPQHALIIEMHPDGPRVFVFGARIHHGPPALFAAAALLLVAWHDRRDFPWSTHDDRPSLPPVPPALYSHDQGELRHPDDVAHPGW